MLGAMERDQLLHRLEFQNDLFSNDYVGQITAFDIGAIEMDW